MAEVLAGLLTSAVVGIVKDKLASAIMEKANLLWNFDDDLEDMMSLLESISAALQDAERRSIKEKLVQLWLKRLKNAALDISDMLEDYQDTSKQLTATIPRALSCLPIACQKISLANRMKSMREQLKKINKQFRDFNFRQGGTTTSIENIEDVRETSSCLPDKPIIGRNVEKQEILNLLYAGTSNEETLIVAIYGLGGMGKSTLAQQIYNDVHFKKYDHRIWVYVSRDFSLRKIGCSIISLLPIEGGQQNRDTLEAINQCIDNQLHGKKVLIVLDDLWEEKDTELGKLRSMLHVGKKGSMIDVIVTTRNEDIARKVSTTVPYKLRPLNDDTCWKIIKETSKFENKHNQEKLKHIGLDISKKCGGMALAAQAVGYLLQSKDLSGWIEINNSDIWNDYAEDDGSVLPSLKLSYERMPPQLRICFSYCGIFQKGHNIAEDDLIHQWIALDFIKPSMGKEYIRQLLGMSFLQVSKLPSASGDHMARYTMHDLVHDLATSIMGYELTSDVALKSNNKHDKKYCRYALVTKYDQAMRLSNILPSKVRALHFSDSRKLDLSCGEFAPAKFLCILDFTGCSTLLLPASIGELKQLKYLCAPRMLNEALPGDITKLEKLQYLNLYGSSRISMLPESFGKLSGCLKYLGLSGCSGIAKLPESFGDLKCIVHLDVSGCSGIRELPYSLGNLTNLQCLKLSECSRLKSIPESLCGLTQLQYLNLSSCDYIVRLPEAIGNLVNLEYLNMSRCTGVRELPESFMRFHNLLHLDLKCCRIKKGLPGALRGLTALHYLDMSGIWWDNLVKDGLPVAMRNLTNLRVLNLASSVHDHFGEEENGYYLNFIGALTNLERLDLSWNQLDWYLPESIGDLQRLHTLNLKGSSSLKFLPESIGNLKMLHTLNLDDCSSLTYLPESIRGATGLKYVLLKRCSDELIDQASYLLHYSLTLPLFKVRVDGVGDHHSNLYLLENDNDIGELDLRCLENVRSLEEAQRLKLMSKHNLLKLTLNWSSCAEGPLEHKDLLAQLLPPMSLKYLTLVSYISRSFPSWVMAISHHLPNLTCIQMEGLPTCSRLPPLGQLENLEYLCLSSLSSIEKIDKGFCGGKGAFPRLARFKLAFMDGLKEWNTTYPVNGAEEFMFPMLNVLTIYNCPRLRLKPCPPKCRQWSISASDQVISSLYDLETSSHRCNSTPTTSLTIQDCKHHSLRLFIHHFPALEELRLPRCRNLMSLPDGMKQLSSLESLELSYCDSISSLPEWLSDIHSLKTLIIEDCTSIKSLPPCIQQLTNLQNLVIRWNQELQLWCESEENKAKLAHIKHIVSS